MINTPDHQQVFNYLRELISEATNHDPSEVFLDSHLEEDLSIPLDDDQDNVLDLIINKINQHFDIELDKSVFLEENFENQTLSFLVELVADEINLQ